MPTTLGQLFVTFGRIAELDTTLLRQFVQTTDEDAFAELVARHGPMVLAVCRRVLRDRHLAEDAFQAVFIVLARRAAQMNVDRPLGPWLYGVAYRTALGALAMRKKQLQREQTALLRSTSRSISEPDDATAVLDEEIAKLSENYRDAIILCELQGVSRSEAAKRLGIPAGTLSSRLATARKTLASRLRQRGVLLGTTLTTTALLSKELLATTVAMSTGKLILSAQLLQLVHGATQMAFLSKLKLMTVAVVVCLLTASGFGLWRVSESKAAPLSNEAKNSVPDSSNINAPLPKEQIDPGVVWIYNWQTGKLLAYRPNGDKLKEYALPSLEKLKGLTPDGTKFVFCKGDADTLHTRSVGDDTPATDLGVKVPYGYGLAWSPDGKRFYLVNYQNEDGDVVCHCGIYTAYGTKEHAFKYKEMSPVSWADNKNLLMVSNQKPSVNSPYLNVFKSPVEAGKLETLFEGEDLDQIQLSPDGKKLLGFDNFRPYKQEEKPNHGVQVYDLNTKKMVDVVRRDKQIYGDGIWSVNGKQIAYRWTDRSPTEKDHAKCEWQFLVCDADGKNEVALMTEPPSEKAMSTHIIGWTLTPPDLKDVKPEARKINAPLPKAKPPEGVIVLSSFGEKKKIELFKPDGESLNVFEPKGYVMNARLAPDGKQATFYDFKPKAGAVNGGWSAFDFCWFDSEADGLEVQKIAENISGGVSNAWSVDGQTVYYSQLDPEKYDESTKPGALLQYRSYAFNFKTKKSTELKLSADQMILDIDPNGKSLLTCSQCQGSLTRSLFLTPLDTCKPQLLMKDEVGSAHTRFSPDGKRLLLSRVGMIVAGDKDKGPGVYLLDLATKKERKIQLPDETKDSTQFNACFSPDGKRLAIHWYEKIPQPRGAPVPVGPGPAGKPIWLASRVTVCDIDGGNAKTIISKDYNESVTGIDWAPVRLPEEKEKADRSINAPLPKQVNRESVLLLSSFNKDKPLEVIKPDGKAVKTIKSEEWFKPLQVELSKDGKRAIFQNMAPIVARKVPFTMQSLGWMDFTTETPEPKWIAQELYYITKAMSADGGTVFYSHIDLEKLGNGPTKGESMPFESWQYDIAKDKKTRLNLPSEHAVIGITPDGKKLLTSTTNHGSYKHSLYLTPLDTMKPEAIREKPFSSVYSPRFSPDGSQLLWICIAEDKAEEVEAGVVITDLKSKKDSHVPLPKDTCVMHVCWSPDGQQIGFAIQQVEKKGNGPAMLSEQRVAVCDFDGTNLKVIQKREPGDDVMGLDWGIANSAAEDKPSREPINAPLPKPKFEWKEGKGIQFKPSPYGDRITGIAHSPDGKFIAVAVGKQVHLLDATTQKPVNEQALTAKAPGTITSVAFSPKGDKLAMTAKDFVFLYSELGKSPSVSSESSWKMDGFDAHQVAWFQNEDRKERLIATNGTEIRYLDVDRKEQGQSCWEANKHKPCVLVPVPGTIACLLQFNNDNTTESKVLWYWDYTDFKQCRRLTGHKARPVSAVVSADGKRIISADEGGTLIVWEGEKNELKETSRIELGEGVAQLALAPDGKTVAFVRTVKVEGTELKGDWRLVEPELHVFDVTNPPAKPKRLWSTKIYQDSRKIAGPVSLSFSPDGKKLLAAFGDPYNSGMDDKGIWHTGLIPGSIGVKVWTLGEPGELKQN